MVVLLHLNKIPGPSGLWNALLMVQAFKNLKSCRSNQDWTFFPCTLFYTGKKEIYLHDFSVKKTKNILYVAL